MSLLKKSSVSLQAFPFPRPIVVHLKREVESICKQIRQKRITFTHISEPCFSEKWLQIDW